MSDSKQTDHWDLLASVLGAEPQKKEPAAQAPQAEERTPEIAEDIIIDEIVEDMVRDADVKASQVEPPTEPAAAPPARQVSNWDALAMELGIEVKPEPPPPPVPSAPVQMFVPKEVASKGVIRSEQPRETARPENTEFGKHIEPSGVSELFSAEEPQEPGEKKSRHRRRRRRKGKDKERPIDGMKKTSFDSQGNEPLEEDQTHPDALLEKPEDSGMEIEGESKEDESEKQHSKHRHSRRGSRKRRKKGSEGDRERGTDAKKAGPAEHAETAVSSETPQEIAGEEENADEEYEDRGQRGAKPGFRAIPTWEEAVGCIVTKNMESRPRRQGGGPPRSRSGSESHKRRRK